MVAVPSAVAISNVTSAPCAGADKLTVNVAVVVPLFPSITVTSLIDRFGVAAPEQLLTGEDELRGNGAETKKSAALSFVSVQPPALRKSALVLLCAGACVEFSEQSAVVP